LSWSGREGKKYKLTSDGDLNTDIDQYEECENMDRLDRENLPEIAAIARVCFRHRFADASERFCTVCEQ
jgi:hypothetical protein